jgi:hypothetical protein
VDHKQQEQVALHRWAVIAEAAAAGLTAAERGALVRQIAARSRAAGRVVPPLLAGDDRQVDPGVVQRPGPTPAWCAPARSCSPRLRRCGWNCPAAPPR